MVSEATSTDGAGSDPGIVTDTGDMTEQRGDRHPGGPEDPAVEAVRAFRDEDIARSAAKWKRIEAATRGEIEKDERERSRDTTRYLAALQNELGLTD